MTMTDDQINEFLGQPLVAVISTLDAEGMPRSTPIWFHWEDGAAYMFTSRGTLKWRNLQANPNASLCVDWREPPYRSVILNGVVEEVDRPLYDLVLHVARRYYGEEKGTAFAEGYRGDSPNTVIFRLNPKHIASALSDE